MHYIIKWRRNRITEKKIYFFEITLPSELNSSRKSLLSNFCVKYGWSCFFSPWTPSDTDKIYQYAGSVLFMQKDNVRGLLSFFIPSKIIWMIYQGILICYQKTNRLKSSQKNWWWWKLSKILEFAQKLVNRIVSLLWSTNLVFNNNVKGHWRIRLSSELRLRLFNCPYPHKYTQKISKFSI